jgi:CzcA family heavy metal efflux pump
MLNTIVRHSLQFRGVVLTLAAILLAYGCYVVSQVKLDVFPEFVQPQVTVQTEAPGLAPEQVEVLVTRPVESAVTGAGNLESVRSESIQGLSIITAVFKEGANIFTARQMLGEKIAEIATELPAGVKSPKMSPLTSSTMDLLKIGLVSDKLSPMKLRTFADWTLRPRMLAVPGVARAIVFGGEVRQLQVQVNPERLFAFDLSLKEVLDAAKSATGVRGAGFVETAAQRILIQSEGQSLTPEQLGNVVIAQHNGTSVRLKDVAHVAEGPEPKFGDSLIMGRPGVLIAFASQFGSNTMEVTHDLEAALDEMKPTFAAQGITVYPRMHRPATFIENAIHNINHSLILGGILVAVVLVLFLLDLRIAFISFVSIPLSLLASVIVLDAFGVTINTITLGGFAVAIGVVVDDAIIDVENILRRLRENLHAAKPRPLFDVVLDASLEVRSAVVYATFIVAMVFLPVLMMTGLQGRFFAPLGVAFILATMASLLVALTLTPALCFAMLSRVQPHEEPRYIRWLKSVHAGALRRFSKRRWLLIGAALALFAVSLATIPFFGTQFLPEFREGHFVLHVTTAPGTSLAEMLRLGKHLHEELAKIDGIATIEQQIGRAEQGEDTWPPNISEFHIELKPATSGGDQEKIEREIRDTLEKFPGIDSETMTFLGDRLSETISGEVEPVVVNVFGEDLDTIDAKANEVARALKSVPGAREVKLKAPPGAPRMAVRLRGDRLTQFGFRPLEVLEAIETAFQGAIVAQVYEGPRLFDVAVVLDATSRRDPEGIGALMLANADGVRLPLRQLAEIFPTSGRHTIQHEGARRRQIVTCNPDRDVGAFVDDAKKAIAEKVKFPAGVYPTFTGAAEQTKKAWRELVIHSLIAGAAVVLLLSVVFRNPRNLALVLANVPFALVGGLLAAFAFGAFEFFTGPHEAGAKIATLSLGSLVGFVTLFGITMRNSIMLISHYEHLVTSEGMEWNLDCAIRGASERLLPIVMTALVTALGLLPLAIGTGEAGREIEGPMAIVILGGLFTSTALNLLVLPALALRFGRFGSGVAAS